MLALQTHARNIEDTPEIKIKYNIFIYKWKAALSMIPEHKHDKMLHYLAHR